MDDPNQTITPNNPEPKLKNDELWPSQQGKPSVEPLEQPCMVRSIATGDKVFLIMNDEKRHIPSPETLKGLGYDFGDEMDVAYQRINQYKDGAVITTAEVEKLKEELKDKMVINPKKGKSGATKPASSQVDTTPGVVAQVAEQRPVEAKVTGSSPVNPANKDFYYEVNGGRPEAIFIVPLIRTDYIGRFLETLYHYTPIDFKVVVIDQTFEKTEYEKYGNKVQLWINSYRNLGFSKAHNTGAVLALRQEPRYIVFANDDIEFMDTRWWGGIQETFDQDPHIIGVNPDSPRIAMWGYGLNDGYLDVINYKPNFTGEDYDFLLKGDFSEVKKNAVITLPDGSQHAVPDSFPERHVGVIDAVATWCTAFRTEMLEKVGLWDERFFPGSGEDYDMMARAYSSAWPQRRDEYNDEQHYRVVGTTKSWAWHWWTRSKDYFKDNPEVASKLVGVRNHFSDAGAAWRNENDGNFDVWGNYDKNGIKTPLKREQKIVVESL